MHTASRHILFTVGILLLSAFVLQPWPPTYTVSSGVHGEWTGDLYWVRSHHWPLGQDVRVEGAFESRIQAQSYINDLQEGKR